jgi:hypothetical protein
LAAKICHTGTAKEGHYQALLRIRSRFHAFSDENAFFVSEQKFLDTPSYLAFYLKESDMEEAKQSNLFGVVVGGPEGFSIHNLISQHFKVLDSGSSLNFT